MPETIYGIFGNDIVPQPGFRLTRNENGGVTASQSYLVRTENIDANIFAKGVAISRIDPNVNPAFNFLSVVSFDITDEEGGVSIVNVNYTGSAFATYNEDGLGEDAIPTYSFSFTLSQKPISEHPKFKALDLGERLALGALLSGVYYLVLGDDNEVKLARDTEEGMVDVEESDNISTETAKEFAKLIARGIDSYQFPTFQWTETTQGEDGLTTAQINKAGKIATPRGSPPNPGDGRNWMLTGASQDQSGKLKQTTLEWTLSEAEGHNELLYKD